MREDGSDRAWPAWVDHLASILLVLALVAVPVALVVHGLLSGGDEPRGGGPTPPVSTAPSAPVSSAPSPTGEPLPSASGETCVPGPLTDLTVVSFNIESAHGPDGSVQLDLLARTLASWKPDIVLLQEVDKNQLRSGRVDMPAYLGERLDMSSTFGANLAGRAGGQYGTALLSRYPILRAENSPLPRLPGDEQRGLLHAVLDVDGTQLSAYVVHLQHSSTRARMRQIDEVRRLVADDELPKVIGGDFNAHPGSPVMTVARAIAADTWTAVGTGPGLTVPRLAPRGRIDYLLQAGLVPVDMQVLLPPLSDHRALWARYGLGANGDVCLPSFG
ncbi:metal-dependent hydrolase [Nocardioides sp. MAH-18]|uniref:Metal-dependent hydrolase n=1 Tax=Nocardioides agri TaxID=2682843 RepID=A0A6L6Y0Y8_9ACTN|nr:MULTISPECIES: endonuclease/exonuclease/phosphatase family protein [unclassified Nocardioides]MBA2956382.1 endonuclease/exonuclease/phosphatase family protein [Nocardioides sp. CGMCC 1.13656]MVQ51225.1 metal-dependent hydrolase [Nocardioides sp. MAH-18]